MEWVVFVVGLALVLGIGQLVGLRGSGGILGGLVGVVLSATGSGIIWGVGAAVLTGGLTLSFWCSAVRDYLVKDGGLAAPIIAHRYPRAVFSFVRFVNYLANALVIIGAIALIARWFL